MIKLTKGFSIKSSSSFYKKKQQIIRYTELTKPSTDKMRMTLSFMRP